MVRFHNEQRALATLAVQERKSSRYLLFDEQLQLCGRRFEREDRTDLVRSAQPLEALAFSGIHVISSQLLTLLTEDGAFSIIDSYLRLAANGERFLAFRAEESYWRDLGTIDSMHQAELDLRRGMLPS